MALLSLHSSLCTAGTAVSWEQSGMAKIKMLTKNCALTPMLVYRNFYVDLFLSDPFTKN